MRIESTRGNARARAKELADLREKVKVLEDPIVVEYLENEVEKLKKKLKVLDNPKLLEILEAVEKE